MKKKSQVLIDKRESACIKYFDDSKVFIEYSNDMDDICKNVEEYNPNKKRKAIAVFDGIIADMRSNKILIVTQIQ